VVKTLTDLAAELGIPAPQPLAGAAAGRPS